MQSNIETNKALIRRFFEAIEKRDLAVFDKIVAADYNDHLQGQSPGRENLKKYFSGLHAAFSNLKFPISAMIAEGEQVAVLNSVQGTHTGDFGAIKATGKKIDVRAFQLYRVENGQLAEHWEVADFATLLAQLKA